MFNFRYKFTFPDLAAEGEVRHLLANNFYQRNFQLRGDGTSLYITEKQLSDDLIKEIKEITGHPVEEITGRMAVRPAVV